MLRFPGEIESKALSSLTAKATNLLNRESPTMSQMCFACLLAIVASTAGLIVALGATVTLYFPWDIPLFLDGGWRVMSGQIPHVDFHTGLGPVTLLLVAFGMWLGGANVSSIAYANACSLVVFSLWAWSIARTRMSAALSLLFSLYVSFTVAATSNYGYDFKCLSYGAMYNRYGFALTALIFIEAFGCPRKPSTSGWSSALQGMSTGIALALTFFLKISFFGVALMALAVGTILAPQNRFRWMGLGAGALMLTLPMLMYLRFDVAAIFHDLIMAGRLRTPGLGMAIFLAATDPAPFSPFGSGFLMAMLWCIGPAAPGRYRAGFTARIASGLFVLFLIFSQTILSLTTTQPPLPTLFPVASLLILEGARRIAQQRQAADPPIQTHHSTGWLATLLLALYLVASILVPDMESLPYSVFERFRAPRRTPPVEKFNSPPMADMIAPRHPEYVRIVNDGCELLRSHSKPSDRIVTMDLTNPFSFALKRVPPTGDALWWAYDSFSRHLHPDPEQVFGQATVVMVPKKPIVQQTEQQPIDVYAAFIDTHYTLEAESTFWRLYQRRSN